MDSKDFQDDGVIKYVIEPNDPGLDDWIAQSKNLGERCRKEREAEEKIAAE